MSYTEKVDPVSGEQAPVLRFEDLPEMAMSPISGQSPPGRSRREALRMGMGLAAAAVAASTLNLLRAPAPAGASGPGMDRYPSRNPYGSGSSPCFSDSGCTGPTADLIDSSYCSNCSDYRANNNNWIGFMYTGGRGNAIYDDHPDRFCAGPYDYWVHDGYPCGYCPYDIAYRCHDGIKYTSGGNSEFVICHSVVICNGEHQSVRC